MAPFRGHLYGEVATRVLQRHAAGRLALLRYPPDDQPEIAITSERTPSEIRATNDLADALDAAIGRSGVDGQGALDALECVMGNLMIEVVTDEEHLKKYLAIIQERTVGMYKMRNPS